MPFLRKKARGTQRQFANILESVLLLAAVAFDPHRDARRKSLDRRVEKIEQVAYV